ncbi:MAG: sterol desaturase family protein [Parvibaculaceae bacterium]
MQNAPAIIANEATIRFAGFAFAFGLLIVLELLSPAHQLMPRVARWRTNIGLIAAGTLLLRLVFPLAAFGVSIWAQAHQVGLFHALNVPFAAAFISTLLALDLLIYGQHVVMHRFPILWRLHKVHHADPNLDVTTALRFHPFEIALSMIVKMAAVLLLGAPPSAVLAFEVLLNASAMFNHANLWLSARSDRVLRRVLVTPDMHRVHHSVEPSLQNKNFGFNLSLWDRIFATYQSVDKAGLSALRIGLGHDDTNSTRFFWSLILPFLNSDTKNVASDERTGGGKS